MNPPHGTRWTVSRRRYVLGDWYYGVAEKVRAERKDAIAWVRLLEAMYWWPEHEGKEWPGVVVPGPEWTGVGPEPDVWAHFEATLGITDDRFIWEALAGAEWWTAGPGGGQ